MYAMPLRSLLLFTTVSYFRKGREALGIGRWPCLCWKQLMAMSGYLREFLV